jgi:hypothetical protein
MSSVFEVFINAEPFNNAEPLNEFEDEGLTAAYFCLH